MTNLFDGRVALLTNFLPPYRIRVLDMLRESVRHLRIFVSVSMESNRRWHADWGSLDVVVQRTLSISGRAKHAEHFQEDRTVHIPYDTLFQLAAYQPTAIIAAEFGMRTMQAALYKCLFPRTKLIVWATLSEVTEKYRGPVRRAIRRSILKVTDGVLVNGLSGARYVESLGYSRSRIHIVPQATDNEIFAGSAFRSQGGATKLLYTGQLIERKGLPLFHQQLVRWCAAHPEREITWTLIGSGPLRESIQGWDCPSNYTLTLVDEVDYRDLGVHYSRADIFTLPTLADEWGLVVNEAMISGLPVLGSLYSQAVEDLVVNGESGWTFQPDNPEELYRALEQALDCDAAELDWMRQNAIERVRPLDAVHMRDLIVRALKS